jgi:tetratricopeptide (TPR) repeat protein
VFATVTPGLRASIDIMLAGCEQANGESEAAYGDMLLAGQTDPGIRTAQYWLSLAILASVTRRYDVAADAMAGCISASPADAASLDSDLLREIVNDTHSLKDGETHRQVLLEALRQVNYAPPNGVDIGIVESFWFELFEIDVAQGRDAEARDLLKKIDRPSTIAKIRADARYRRFVEGNPMFTDGASINERYVANRKAFADAHPRQIGSRATQAVSLMEVGRVVDALALLDDALAKVNAAPAGQLAFDDQKDNLRWALDDRNRVLWRMGRWDEAIATQTRARENAAVSGGDSVSQKINLADLLYLRGRPRDALAELTGVTTDTASDYGLMEAEEVRACSYAQLGDRDGLKAALDTLRTHRDDAPNPLRAALQCADDEDGLAATIVARLDDPLTRNDELGALQIYLPEPHPTEFEALMNKRFDTVRNRADVRAAVAKYGFIEAYPVYAPNR